MNFLAHIYLSFDDEEVLVGNFIGDFVKGQKMIENYPVRVQKGIRLHREIDFYTDTHPAMEETKRILRPYYGKFSGIVSDIYNDHLLAAAWNNYAGVDLQIFAYQKYAILKKYWDIVPIPFQDTLAQMIERNWLISYASLKGLSYAFKRTDERLKGVISLQDAIANLELHRLDLETNFDTFFPELVAFAKNKLPLL